MDYQPWDDDKRKQLHCGACAVNKHTRKDAPDYAGWLRVYVQYGRPVPRRHYASEIAYAKAENMTYHDAIMRDIATWGITFTDEEV